MDWPLTGAYAAAFFLTLGYLAMTSEHGARPPEAPASERVSVVASRTVGSPIVRTAVKADAADRASIGEEEWVVPDIEQLPDDAWGRLVRKGRDLTVETFAHIGPEVEDSAMRFTGNNLACQSCHLEAGTKQYGLPFIGVFGDFPQYRAREGEVGTLEDRINGCMTRSMNGRPLPSDSEEMKAFVAYIKFLSTNRPVGSVTMGRGSGKMAELARPANPEAGAAVFEQHCAVCHGNDGLGQRAGTAGDGEGYVYPPLWGSDSFNNGAGMGRLISAANFIRNNMPFGTTHDAPVLTVEEAWDVAAYMVSMSRPHKSRLESDFPNRTEKPVDAAYGPFVDGFSVEQHKYGPFQPIRDELATLKKSAPK